MFAVAANNVPSGLVDLFHGIQVAVMLALMTNILQFAWWKCKAKKGIPAGHHWDRYGPCYLLIVATVLVLVQPTCMLVIGAYGSDDDTMPCPADDASEPVNTHHGMTNFFFEGDDTNFIVPNTTVGTLIQVFGTYLGFAFMFTGVVWSTNLHIKIAKKWRAIRNSRQ